MLAPFLYFYAMAKIKLGALITDASGKLGGHVIGKNKGNFVLKNKSVNKKTPTINQSVQRQTTNFLMMQWSKLTDDQRRRWYLQINDYLEIDNFSDNKRFNGFTLFQKLNQGRLLCGLAMLTTPQQVAKPTFPQILNITLNTSVFTVQSNDYASNDNIALYVSKPLTRGTNNVKKYMRFLTNASNTNLSTGLDITSLYENKFGTLVVDKYIFVGVKTFSKISGYSNQVLTISKKLISSTTVVDNYIFQDGNNFIFQDGNNFIFN